MAILVLRQLTLAKPAAVQIGVFLTFEQLGGPREHRCDGTAQQWAADPPSGLDDLNVIAVRYLPDERVSSLPDDAFVHDGQITKHAIRAVTLATLAL